ncbi:unnamed protein product, partial [Tetraodon nigroviridis]
KAPSRNSPRTPSFPSMAPPLRCTPAAWPRTVSSTASLVNLVSLANGRAPPRPNGEFDVRLFLTGLYMNQMGYVTHPYGSYHSLAQAGGMGGAMMTSQMAMMGQQASGGMGLHQNGVMAAQGVMAQPSGVGSSPYMAAMPQGMMGQQQAHFHHPVYGAQQGQQTQWNVSQVCVCVCVRGVV